MKRLTSIAACVLALVAAASPAAAQGVTLQYKWTQDDVLRYRMTLHTESALSGLPGGADVHFDQTMTQTIKMLVAAVAPDGTATLHQTIEGVKVEMNTPAGQITYDSASPAAAADPMAESMGKVFGAMVGATVSAIIKPDGSVVSVEGATRLLEKITSQLPDDPGAAQMAQSLKATLSDDAIRSMLEQSFSNFPARPVNPGDTWTGHVALGNDAIGRISGTSTFTLNSVGPGSASVAVIGVSLVLKQESAPPVGPAGMIMKLGDSHGEGTIRFDVAKGRILRSTMENQMPSTMSGAGPDGSPVRISNVTKTTMTMELVAR